MEDHFCPKRIMALDVQGKNLRGRPKKRWVEKIQSDISYLGLIMTDIGGRNRGES